MKIISTIEDLRSNSCAKKNRRVLVPTMGALHAGHVELIRLAREHAGPDGEVAVSIFVNPLQFEPGSDFRRYPRPETADEDFCRAEGVDLLFRPSPAEMYFDRSLDLRRRNALAESALRRVAAGTFPRRLHGGGETVSSSRAGCRGLWGKGFSATRDHSPNGARSQFPDRDHRRADGARSGRAGVQFAQSISERGRAKAGADHATVAAGGGSSRRRHPPANYSQRCGKQIESAPLARIDYVELVDAEDLQPRRTIAGPTRSSRSRFSSAKLA